MSTKPIEKPPIEEIIRSNLLARIGAIADVTEIHTQMKRLGSGVYRVNIFAKAEAPVDSSELIKPMKIVRSYYVTADRTGQILTVDPPIIREVNHGKKA